jgi:predicted metal-dependent hydrolase
LNWRIVQAPHRLIDYVVAHELVHLRHADHTRDFWTDLGVVMPEYEERREELRRIGRLLVW